MAETMTARPTRTCEAVRHAAADAALPEIVRWAGNDLDAAEVETVRDLLRAGVRMHSRGYDFAREFDRAGFEPDAELVDLLDNVDTGSAYRDAVKAWIVATGARPQLGIGASVALPAGQRDAGTPGVIVRIDEAEGTYTVCCESLGHVRDGLGTHGRVLAWEDVEGGGNF